MVVKFSSSSLTADIARHAADFDRDRAFPQAAFDTLSSQGLLQKPPIAAADIGALLRVLTAVGRGDLSTGRIYEGHVNACWLIDAAGTAEQKTNANALLAEGARFGVWNTDDPSAPLTLENDRLSGGKNYASGVDGLTHAIVTAPRDAGRQMIFVPLNGLPVNRSWWNPVGMKASGSHIVDMSGVEVPPDWLLGGVDAYIAQPWFTAGALRFLAVQTGGVHAVFDTALHHLRQTGKADNPYQAHRLGRMAAAVETCCLWLEKGARDWKACADEPDDKPRADTLMATVNGARHVVESAALNVLQEAEQAIGAAGMISPHPFERLMRDLRTYLRQPNPDGTLAAFGNAVISGSWHPAQIEKGYDNDAC